MAYFALGYSHLLYGVLLWGNSAEAWFHFLNLPLLKNNRLCNALPAAMRSLSGCNIKVQLKESLIQQAFIA